jgi:hypothetical protein
MIDTSTNKPLRVSSDGDAGPYLMVPLSQLEDVRKLLDEARFSYWVDDEVISLNGEPEVSVVNFGHQVDPVSVQTVLDAAR